MSNAYDAFALSTEQPATANTCLKRLLRMIVIKGSVTLTFDDGSKLVYKRTHSWRTDKLEIVETK